MDTHDRALLERIQIDNRLSHEQLGRLVGLSASSVRRRINRLRESGVIEAEVAVINPTRDQVMVIVLVTFAHESIESVRAFKQRMIAAREVSQCYSVAGQIDYVLVVHARDLGSYESWGERMLMSDPAISRYDTHVVWSRVKQSTAIPIFDRGDAGARAPTTP